jgi:protein-tyrosine phosphatase
MNNNVEEEEDGGVTGADADWTPDLHWLTDQLALGGCFPVEQAERLASEYRIRAVVDLREEDRDDEERLRAVGITLLHLPTPDFEPATLGMLDQGVAFVRERIARGDKILIHCQHGVGRSPLLALCVLVDQGWEPLAALAHAKSHRAAVSPSRLQYDGWTQWLERHGQTAPDYHSFGCIAYRHLAG